MQIQKRDHNLKHFIDLEQILPFYMELWKISPF